MDFMQLSRGHCISKIIHGFYSTVSRTLYLKNYTWILCNCFEDTLSKKLYMDLMQLFRGHSISKIIRGFYATVSRTLYLKNYTWILFNCFEDTLPRKVY